MEKPVGMFSKQAKRYCGSTVWVDIDGTPYEITAYVRLSVYKWPDAVKVTDKPITYHSRHTEPVEYRF